MNVGLTTALLWLRTHTVFPFGSGCFPVKPEPFPEPTSLLLKTDHAQNSDSKVEAFSVGLGPKLLSYRAPSGKGDFFKGTLSGPFSNSDGDGGSDAIVAKPKAEKKIEAIKPTSFWSWGKKEEKQVVEETMKEPEGVEVSENFLFFFFFVSGWR